MSTTRDVTSCNSSYRSSGRANADLTGELPESRGGQLDTKPILRSSQIAEDNSLVQTMEARDPLRPTVVILGSCSPEPRSTHGGGIRPGGKTVDSMGTSGKLQRRIELS
ncbi:unnamed protein product [Lasius platythorax]|uniref:Uncharacterized protein n=1 Tax=Lasius platythorax TaxID=488582 RepID=A0AAV2N0F8_9HYME